MDIMVAKVSDFLLKISIYLNNPLSLVKGLYFIVFLVSFIHLSDCISGWLEGPNKVYIPFLACGDLSGYDSDRSYPLPKVVDGPYQSLDPVQPPIAPPYKRALEMKKASSHGIRDLEKLSLDA